MSYSYIVNRQIHDMNTLQLQIFKSGLTSISHITGTSTIVTIFFSVALTLSQQTDLNTLVINYVDSIEENNGSEFISRINSTNIPLGINGIYEGVYEKISNYSTLTMTCLADVDCDLEVLYSNDGTTNHLIKRYPIRKNTIFIEIKTITFLYYKIRVINDYLAQSSITMQSTAHLYRTKDITDTTQVNEISIKAEETKTGGNFKTTCLSMNIPGNTTSIMTYTKPYRISILELNFRVTTSNANDIINAYIGKDSIIGVLVGNVFTGNTSIMVSNTVIQNIYIGYYLSITDGINTNMLGEVLSITDNILTFSGTITNNFLVGNYVRMSVKPVDNFIMGPPGLYNIGESRTGASSVPGNTLISLEYTNTSSEIKTFTLSLDYLY
jgi:hypothetical protein